MLRTRIRRTVAFVVATSIAMVLTTSPVFAYSPEAINNWPSPTLGSSSTNPIDGTDPDVWWRYGWGNTLHPQFKLNLPEGTTIDRNEDGLFVLGIYYTVDRDPFTQINRDFLERYYNASDSSGSWMNHTLDVNGILQSDPVNLAETYPGARVPIEGVWWFHWSFYDNYQVATTTVSAPFGIDLTPPLPVSRLVAKPSSGYTGPTGDVWFAQNRAKIEWEDKEYDALSGVALYEILLNDEVLERQDGKPAYVYHLGHTRRDITIEDLPSGRNKIQVRAVDRATNRSDPVTTYFQVDTEPPTLSIVRPKADAWVPARSTFSVNAEDDAGVRNVKFYIDGTLVGTLTKAPYSAELDLRDYANGRHSFTVKVTDMFGREVSKSVSFLLDKTPPVISQISQSPEPFYPIIREGYKDNVNVRFHVSEAVNAYLHIYGSDGALYTSRSAPRGPGWATLTWDGADSLGSVLPESMTYTYRLQAIDQAGNQAWTSPRVTTVRNYEIIRVAPNAVRVEPR